MITVTVKDKTAALVFDMTSWEQIEEALGICFPEGLGDLLRKPKVRLQTICSLVEIMSAEGARLGKGEALTAEWLRHSITPKQLQGLDKAVTAATDEGFRLETKPEEGEEGRVVDLAMMEIEKKESPDA